MDRSDKNMQLIMERIKSQRLKLNMSYQDLARETGMSKSTLHRQETL